MLLVGAPKVEPARARETRIETSCIFGTSEEWKENRKVEFKKLAWLYELERFGDDDDAVVVTRKVSRTLMTSYVL